MPNVGIGADGVVGIAIETTGGEYEGPTKFFPIRSEGLQWTQETTFRRVIRNTVDPIGAVPGNGHAEGDIEMEALEDVLPYFLQASRGELTQSGTEPDFTYEFVPNGDATPTETLSITVVRNDQVFGYTGCVVASFSFSVDDGMLTYTPSILGQEEDEENGVSPNFADDGPFGAGTYDVQIPAGTTVEDTDDMTFEVNDNGEVQNRLLQRRGAAFVSYGDREATLSVERDFEDRVEYEEFKDLTAKEITIRAEKDTDRFIEIHMNSAIVNEYEVSLGGTGDLIRASVSYMGTDTASGDGSYKITIGTDEDLALA